MQEIRIHRLPDRKFQISGTVNDAIAKMQFWAASPPQHLQSYSGSGLPFPNRDIAFQNTPSIGTVPVNDSSFSITVDLPNSYYENLGTELVSPRIFLRPIGFDGQIGKIVEFLLAPAIPYRSLTHQASRKSCLFYQRKDAEARTQERILRDCKIQFQDPENFWAKCPPHP